MCTYCVQFCLDRIDFCTRNCSYYVGLACSLTLFVIVVSYLLGLLCGVCNDQPTRYNYYRHSKKSDCLFYFGMACLFISFTCVLVLSTVSFLAGGISDKSLCFYLKNTSNPQSELILSMLQRTISEHQLADQDFQRALNSFKSEDIVNMMNRCHQNQSLFNVLELTLSEKIKILGNDQISYINISDIIQFKEVS